MLKRYRDILGAWGLALLLFSCSRTEEPESRQNRPQEESEMQRSAADGASALRPDANVIDAPEVKTSQSEDTKPPAASDTGQKDPDVAAQAKVDPARVAQCEALANERFAEVSPALTRLGVDLTSAREKIWAHSEYLFFKRCPKRSPEEMSCLEDKKRPRDCGLKWADVPRMTIPKELIPKRPKQALSAKAAQEMLAALVGTWKKTDEWETQTWTVYKDGRAVVETIRDGQDKKEKTHYVSFRSQDQITLGNVQKNSWQTIPFFRTKGAMHLYFNNYYSAQPLANKDKFTLYSAGDVVFYDRGACTILDVDSARFVDGRCSWTKKDGRARFSLRYRDTRSLRTEQWVRIKGHLVHDALYRQRFVRQK